MRQGWMKKDRLGTNIKVTGIARCAWDLRTKHWLWSKHVPEQKKQHNLQDRCLSMNKNFALSSMTQIRNRRSLI